MTRYSEVIQPRECHVSLQDSESTRRDRGTTGEDRSVTTPRYKTRGPRRRRHSDATLSTVRPLQSHILGPPERSPNDTTRDTQGGLRSPPERPADPSPSPTRLGWDPVPPHPRVWVGGEENDKGRRSDVVTTRDRGPPRILFVVSENHFPYSTGPRVRHSPSGLILFLWGPVLDYSQARP